MGIIYSAEEICELKEAVNKPKTKITPKPTQEPNLNLVKLDITKLANSGVIKKIPANTIMFELGDIGDEFYIILKGVANIVCQDDKIISSLKSGDIFGEMSILENMPRNSKFKSVSELVFLVVQTNQLENLVENIPSIAIKIMQTLSQRVRQLNQAIILLKAKEVVYDDDLKTEIDALRTRVAELEFVSSKENI